ncbi:helix-turn-helix transcriptional regulator [Butyrivibrio sp. AE3006]|uniref:helix-turn-helix transcriptional regulator n=1 Tax=Butyrivibrio sp. AE3006 TaxID=1280673 RepID=UPI00047EFCEE|nr:LuxR C-terminal-related transcriptional regulator [Butyrivibrio sp. AE3006]
MPKRKSNLNTIYISERLQESLRPISDSALTTIIAPMGYGKTTAINWFLSQKTKEDNCKIIRISAYSDNLTIFWRSVTDAFVHAGLSFMQNYPFPTDAAAGGLLADDMCYELSDYKECYIFIDDFHLLRDFRVSAFISTLANRIPETVHIIIASRDRFLSSSEILRLGAKLYQIGIDQLRLNHTELSVYAHRCGTDLTDEQIKSLLYSCEGWFSAIYLNLRTLLERGSLPDSNSDIYTIFTAAMIEPLPGVQREFIAVMGLADEFSVSMAEFVTGLEDAETLVNTLTERNAFVTKLPEGQKYRFHHMMKECAERSFKTLPKEKQDFYRNRYGKWYEEHQLYLHAIAHYRISENYDAFLKVIKLDAGILLSTLKPQLILDELAKIPDDILLENPFSILVLMRCMFNWRQIPKMMELKEKLGAAIKKHPEMPEEERGNLMGESDLIMSFLMYNDITAMSKMHRKASEQMTGIAMSLRNTGGWSFSSPSIIMMYHRIPGGLESEMQEMDECMPHYYKITDGHGLGAEKIMRAEMNFLQGDFDDAQIELESAYIQIENTNQKNMALCADFAARRLSLFTNNEERYTAKQRYDELLKEHNIALINIWHATYAYYYAVLEQADKIPDVYRDHKLSTMNILAPGKPMHEMIENQVYLAQGSYAKVIGRSEGLFAACDGLHYNLVKIHVQIQTAAAYEMMGKRLEAHKMLEEAVKASVPDRLYMPFAENYNYIKDLLDLVTDTEYKSFVSKVKTFGENFEGRRNKLKGKSKSKVPVSLLSKREFEIASLMETRLSNKEIAEQLFLSEGSVKQYINQMYTKLDIKGDRQTKRKLLFEYIDKIAN